MALNFQGMINFAHATVGLTSFPIFCVYLLMIWLHGTYRKYTKPLELRLVLIVYNFLCCAFSGITLCGFIYGLSRCSHIFQREETAFLKNVYFLYWLTKIIELLDTVFMILRHKSRQISFLHIYHHASMILLIDYAYHYAAWPAIAPILALNSLVHVVLYFYYGLTALYPNNTLQWKKHLTQLQIIQFLLDFIHATWGYIYYGFCVYGLFYGIIMTSLFCNFYYYAYIRTRPTKVISVQNGTLQGASKSSQKSD